ncbi:RagB/SusD family nutrient uptake outer membrane protein [uncultured Parabacteroides sp.]|uniref:RagB/SusD family nutrient uptake outer membrane protein n=1 Tax=uncultured Parabacteroides sp. TaxID=512312 RepID=UPI0026351049|nr:RagB/SusD family nutrient uptake outer membrane protein [uncultured Parabacteroides sp.]
MKSIIKYFCSLAIAFVLTGCNDGFLDRLPSDQLADESFWKLENDAVQYTAACYRYLIDPAAHLMMTDCFTDNGVPIHLYEAQGTLSSGTATSTNTEFSGIWSTAYSGIRRCDVFFQNIEKVEMNENRKSILVGEIEFLRAFHYATLLKHFGGVPILAEPLKLYETIPARNTAEEVYKFILEECDKAALKLPVVRSEVSEIGRATKGAAMSLKAQISFFMQDYKTTVIASKDVMELGVYKLFDDYSNLFSPDFENNCEVIFDRQYMENAIQDGTGSMIDQYWGPQIIGGWEGLSPVQDLVDEFECTDGQPISTSPSYDPASPYENRDPRLKASILWHGREFGGFTYSTEGRIGKSNSTRTGYTYAKYINEKNIGMKDYGWTNFIYIRYADILLMYAYAQNELSGPDKTVYDAVNAIRQRPTVDLPPLISNLTKEQMREAIRHERRVEFVFEGIHFFDTRSWKTTEACVKKPVYGMDCTGEKFFIEQRKFDPNKDYVWAIPLTEIELSQGALEQNPGW